MVSSVKLKITMRYNMIIQALCTAHYVQQDKAHPYHRDMWLCDHKGSARCLLASTLARALPGCMITVASFVVAVDTPALYDRVAGDLRLPVPVAVRRWMTWVEPRITFDTVAARSCHISYSSPVRDRKAITTKEE